MAIAEPHLSDLELMVEGDHEGINRKEQEFLEGEGFEILHKLGEGQTRFAYLAKYQRGDVSKLMVVKIPKSEIDESSICTIINLSKEGDMNQREVLTSNEISHINVVSIMANYHFGNKVINIEEYVDGTTDLESLIKNTGPLSEEKFESIFRGVLAGLKYLNLEKNILHRDIKPSNLLVGREGRVQITDLQNAARKRDIESLSMPTRGGTQYTHPDLLNALLTENSFTHATEATEAYALGATMYYALTGENPFEYKLVVGSDGRELEVGGKTFRVSLQDGDRKLEKITIDEHEKLLKKAMKKVPKKYQKMINNSLTLNPKKGWGYNVGSVEYDLDKTKEGLMTKIGKKALKAIKPALIVGAFGALFGWGISHSPETEQGPSLRDIMSRQNYREFSLETIDGPERNFALDLLSPEFRYLRKELPDFLDNNISKRQTQEDEIEQYTNFAHDIHSMPKRLISSWLTALYMVENPEKLEKSYDGERTAPSFTPNDFVLMTDRLSQGGNFNYGRIPFGVMYLKQCLGPGNNVADTFAEYFFSNEEINTARVRTKSISYLPRYNPEDHSLECGYSQFLDPRKRKVVDAAIALYMITDEEGVAHTDSIPDLRGISGTYSHLLSIPP